MLWIGRIEFVYNKTSPCQKPPPPAIDPKFRRTFLPPRKENGPRFRLVYIFNRSTWLSNGTVTRVMMVSEWICAIS